MRESQPCRTSAEELRRWIRSHRTIHTGLATHVCPGFVYGGLIASLVDCHAMATAAASEITDDVAPRFVTAALHVEYLKPTPLGPELVIRGRVTERSPRKAVVELTVQAGETITVRANAVAVRLPRSMDSTKG
jgi:acyl-coenzyme A thioesterase PaaI-like protein